MRSALLANKKSDETCGRCRFCDPKGLARDSGGAAWSSSADVSRTCEKYMQKIHGFFNGASKDFSFHIFPTGMDLK